MDERVWMGVGRQLERLIRNLMLPLMTSEPDKHLSNISKNLAVHPHVVSVCVCVCVCVNLYVCECVNLYVCV